MQIEKYIVAGAVFAAFLLFNPGRAETSDRGRLLFESRCSGCHALDNERQGPRLRGVYGRNAGTVQSFTYSNALKASRLTWDAAALDRWLADPEKLVPDNDMAFRMPNPDDRAAIIGFLKGLSGK
jgi:cytochrome c